MSVDPQLGALYDAVFVADDDEALLTFVTEAVKACQQLASWDDRARFVAVQTIGANGRPRWVPSGEVLRQVYAQAAER